MAVRVRSDCDVEIRHGQEFGLAVGQPFPADARPLSRPAVEVADIFRHRGPAWRASHAGHVSLGQLRSCRWSVTLNVLPRLADCLCPRRACFSRSFPFPLGDPAEKCRFLQVSRWTTVYARRRDRCHRLGRLGLSDRKSASLDQSVKGYRDFFDPRGHMLPHGRHGWVITPVGQPVSDVSL